MKPIMEKPNPQALAIFRNSFASGFVHAGMRRLESFENLKAPTMAHPIGLFSSVIAAGNFCNAVPSMSFSVVFLLLALLIVCVAPTPNWQEVDCCAWTDS